MKQGFHICFMRCDYPVHMITRKQNRSEDLEEDSGDPQVRNGSHETTNSLQAKKAEAGAAGEAERYGNEWE